MEKQLIDGICFTFLKVRSLLMPQHLKGQQINSGSLMVILKKNFSPCHHIMSNVVSCRKLMRRFPNSNPIKSPDSLQLSIIMTCTLLNSNYSSGKHGGFPEKSGNSRHCQCSDKGLIPICRKCT